MTEAVCFKCGDHKLGAFSNCKNCGARPRSDDDLMLSLALTDHYFDHARLEQMGRDIAAGRLPQLDQATKEKLRPAVAEAKRILGIGRDKKRQVAPASRLFGLSGIVDKIRNSKEERRCYLAAMKECEFVQSQLEHLLDGFPALAVDPTMKKVRHLIRRTKSELVKSVRNGLSYRTIIFLLISNVTWEELRTGEHMVYRNYPSMMGEGFKGLFLLSSDTLVSCGYQTQAEADAEKEQLFELLKNLG
ncbi:hypothetical protein ACFLEY_22410 [Bradyrhizobium sp. YCK136]|uniref:hypothetical protein n=1 Tax=Bradyrhizobium sp. YCK136 TaxID=3351346 RepID=UPI0037C69916